MPDLAEFRSESAEKPTEPDAQPIAREPVGKEAAMSESRLGSLGMNWQLKAIAPVALTLLAGLLLFVLATVSFRDPERHAVLVVAGAGAIAICAVSIFALAWFVQRPMVELQEKIARLGEGDLSVR
jgi:methyl-accepting chemotaxis protein